MSDIEKMLQELFEEDKYSLMEYGFMDAIDAQENAGATFLKLLKEKGYDISKQKASPDVPQKGGADG